MDVRYLRCTSYEPADYGLGDNFSPVQSESFRCIKLKLKPVISARLTGARKRYILRFFLNIPLTITHTRSNSRPVCWWSMIVITYLIMVTNGSSCCITIQFPLLCLSLYDSVHVFDCSYITSTKFTAAAVVKNQFKSYIKHYIVNSLKLPFISTLCG